jgi:hypothetical protein
MIGRAIKHSVHPQLKTVRSVRAKLDRRYILSAHACEFSGNAIHPRRINHLANDDDGLRSLDDKKQGPMSRVHDRDLGRSPNVDQSESSRAMIAFGSNLGDKVGHIETALTEMEKRRLKIKSVSGLYETDPMYVTDQHKFLNGACEVSESITMSFTSDLISII